MSVRAARRWARVELLVALVVGSIGPGLFILAPGLTSPWFFSWPSAAMPFVGAAVWLAGFVAMWRIYRADPEPDLDAWRYRAAR